MSRRSFLKFDGVYIFITIACINITPCFAARVKLLHTHTHTHTHRERERESKGKGYKIIGNADVFIKAQPDKCRQNIRSLNKYYRISRSVYTRKKSYGGKCRANKSR